MADYIGISKSLTIVGITPKPEINYFYGPWESKEEALTNIPQLARIKGLTVGIIEDSEIVEYWFKNGVELVLKLVDPKLVYTTNEIQQIINDLENTYVRKEIGKVLIPSTSLDKLNKLPTKESIDNTYVAKEVGKSLIADSKIAKLDSLPSSVYSQAETNQVLKGLDTKINTKLDTKVDKVTGSRLLTDLEANTIAEAVTFGDLEPYSLKDTEELEEIIEVSKEEKQYIKFFDEEEGIEKKITLANIILSASNPVYPTYRSLEGNQSGTNTQFKYRGTLIPETAELYIGGLLYPVNIGFTFGEGEGEDKTILITGAPVPTSEDIMRLKAIYLT